MVDRKRWWQQVFLPWTGAANRRTRPAWQGRTLLQLEFLEARLAPASYNVAQIRSAYGINSIPNFGTAAADGSGQTIAVVDAYNDPSILTDLDGFDKAMSLTATSTQTLYQQYGAASAFVNVFNQSGKNITSILAASGSNGVPSVDPTGGWEGEETMDVEWAHAIAPGAKIDVIETDDETYLENGDQTAAGLPGVSVVSNSWNAASEWDTETTTDDMTYFVTPSGHTGVTFLDSSGDEGAPSGYPSYSPNVISVGGTTLTVNGNTYGGETGWSFPTPRTLNIGSTSFAKTGTWTANTGGFSGTYDTAPAGSTATATWTTTITANDAGPDGGTIVYATWTASPTNATDATYNVYDGTASAANLIDTITVDQTQAPVGITVGNTQFEELDFEYPYSGTLTVELDASTATGTVVADAIGISADSASSGGISQYETEPAYQTPFQNSGYREAPDVSFVADPNPGVWIYQADQGGLIDGNGGTSLSCPCWAGIIAIVNQGRVAEGGTTLDSSTNPTQAEQGIYSLPASDFHAITVGYNGYSAAAGYNMVTGRGSPIANTLVPDLVSFQTTPAALAFTAQPSNTTTGNTIGTVSVQDISGTTPVAGVVVTIGIAAPGKLTGTVTATTNATGIATFSTLSAAIAGSFTLTASVGAITATSSSFTVAAPVLTTLAFITQPISLVAGSGSISTVVLATDQLGFPMPGVSLTYSVAPGKLTGTTVVTTGPGGLANLTDTSTSAATYTLTATATGGTVSVASNPFVIAPAAVATLSFSVQPAGTSVGSSLGSVTVHATDKFGNAVPGVSISLALSVGLLSGTTAVSSDASGNAVFSTLSIATAGNYTLKASATGVAATSAPFTIAGLPLASLSFTTQPASTTAGSNLGTVTVVALNTNGQPVGGKTVTVSISSGKLGGTLSAVTNALGQAIFNTLTETIAGAYTLTAASGTTNTISSSFTITPAAAILAFSTQPTSTLDGSTLKAVNVKAADKFGNAVSGATINLTLSAGTLGGTTSVVTDATGLASFTTLSVNLAGTYTIAAATPGGTGARSSAFVISPLPLASLTFTTQPASTTAGSFLGAVTVTALNTNGLPYAKATIAIGISLGGTMAGTLAVVTNAAGQAVFANLYAGHAGTFTLTARTGTISTVSSPFVITAGAPTAMAFVKQPTTTAVGSTISAVAVLLKDKFGNLVSGASVAVALSRGSLASGTTPVTTNAAGQAVFSDLAINTMGIYALLASVTGLPRFSSQAFAVTPGAAAALTFLTQPRGTTAGARLSPFTIAVVDQFGNIVPGAGRIIMLSENGMTTGPYKTSANGEAVIANWTDSVATTHTLTALSSVPTAVTAATSQSFTITPGRGIIHFLTGPLSATAGSDFGSVSVIVTDAFGNLLTGPVVVYLRLSSGTISGGVTSATTNASGVATFDPLVENAKGNYRLIAWSTNLAAVASTAFTIS